MAWRISVGNVVSRAPAVMVASGCSVDADHPLSGLGSGQAIDPARFVLEADGVYAAVLDSNLLAETSARSDAPLGWSDLLLSLAGTPGAHADAPSRSTLGGRAKVVQAKRPLYQDVEIGPGEAAQVLCGLRLPAGSTATRISVLVQDLSTGRLWDQADTEWDDTGEVGAATSDAWVDLDVTLDAPEGTERTTYRVILLPAAPAFGSTSLVWISDPCIVVGQSIVAVVGHNLPDDAVVTWAATGGPTWTLPKGSPTRWYVAASPAVFRTWTLTITYPTDLAPISRPPEIGELWAGPIDDLACPSWPLELTEADLAQSRVVGGGGQITASTTTRRAPRLLSLSFVVAQTAQAELRDAFVRATRWGVDPAVLIPVSTIDGSVAIHGRLRDSSMTASYQSNSKRAIPLVFSESPFA